MVALALKLPVEVMTFFTRLEPEVKSPVPVAAVAPPSFTTMVSAPPSGADSGIESEIAVLAIFDAG
jgi:hypothetical protein